jgi:hypothetical protein
MPHIHPILVKIPLASSSSILKEDEDQPNLGTGNIFTDIWTRFEDIMDRSKESAVTKDTKLAKTKWADWWETRTKLDTQLAKLTDDLESLLLGNWKGLLMGSLVDSKLAEALLDTARVLIDLVNSKLAAGQAVDEELVAACLRSLPYLTCNGNNSLLDKCVAEMMGWDFSKLSPKQDLEVKKVELLDSCADKLQISKTFLSESLDLLKKAGISEPKQIARNPMILILDSKLQDLPWENIPILQDYPGSPLCKCRLLHAK